MPVLALRYHCDPPASKTSCAGADSTTPYAGHMQSTLSRLTACGVTLCTMNELLAKLAQERRRLLRQSTERSRGVISLSQTW